jgi:HAD superfamily hydrolase (TIGR01459 family)
MPEPRSIAGLRQIDGDFDAFLVDQYGVMHDGQRPYHGAVEALTHLTRAGKAVIVLTNSGKRSEPNRNRIRKIGFPSESFSGLVSSGEVAWTGIRDGSLGPAFKSGAKTAVVGKAGDDYGLDGLGLVFSEDFEQVDIVLIMGSDCPRTTLDDYRRRLAPAARRGAPALCCNPDLAMLTSHGLQPSAGAIAKVYAELGGPVTFVGKPYPAIYKAAAELARVEPPRTLAIGDSLDHDIRGGAEAGLRTALVRTGVLAEMDGPSFTAELAAAPRKPDFMLPGLVW